MPIQRDIRESLAVIEGSLAALRVFPDATARRPFQY